MKLGRREFLAGAGAVLGGGSLAALLRELGDETARPGRSELRDWSESPAEAWDSVRAEFALAPELTHLSTFLVGVHPKPVRDAIERHRRGLDETGSLYLEDENERLQLAVIRAAACATR